IDVSIDAEQPAFVAAANAAARTAVDREIKEGLIVTATELSTPRTLTPDDAQWAEIELSFDFRHLGGVLRDDGTRIEDTLPGYDDFVIPGGFGRVDVTRDYRRVEPGGLNTLDAQTPQPILDAWSRRMPSSAA